MALSKVDFEALLSQLKLLTRQQKRLVRQQLDKDWSQRFGATLDAIHAAMPDDISEEQVRADIESAIDDTRAQLR